MNIKIAGWALGILMVLYVAYLSIPTTFSVKGALKYTDSMIKVSDAVIDPEKADKI